MRERLAQKAATWTALFYLAPTDEVVAVGSWTDPAAADEWALNPWFQQQHATFRGVVPLIQPDDLITELGGAR